MLIKAVASILGYKAELLTADQIMQLCAHLKLTGYQSKSKEEALRIIAVSKIHSELNDATGIAGDGAEKQPAKTKNCIFRLINVLFSDEMSAKFLKLGERKDKNTLDSGLAAYGDFLVRSLGQTPDIFYMFDGIDPSVKLSYSWSKLQEMYKALVKDYEFICNNHKKVATMMTSLIFATTRVKCTTYTCGCKKNQVSQILWLLSFLRKCLLRALTHHFAALPQQVLTQLIRPHWKV